ncbi:MAG: hypothetical protein QNK05_01300 [Myxococcota bacterium]|nr:hypothetical protein [Myxococcota bacterium]
MPKDFSLPLFGLKLGAAVNLALLYWTLGLESPDPHAVIPAWILLCVSAFRCLFPNRYLHNVVFHDTPLSSIFLTRLLATFSEVAYIYQFSHVIRVLNVDGAGWIDALSWLMVVQVVVSQGFVWTAIGTRRLGLYFHEELGWFVIFAANTLASAVLLATAGELGDGRVLLVLNVGFGAFYLPWQVLHLRSLRAEATPGHVSWASGLGDALRERNRRTDAASWGGWIGLTWMVAYWATLIPAWVTAIAVILSGS